MCCSSPCVAAALVGTRDAPAGSTDGLRLDRQPGGPPLGEALYESADLETVSLEQLRGLVGVHAVRAATVGDDVAIAWHLSQAALQFGDRNRTGGGDVPLPVLGLWADIEQRHRALLDKRPQLGQIDRGETGAVRQVRLDEAVDLGESGGAQVAQGAPQSEDFGRC